MKSYQCCFVALCILNLMAEQVAFAGCAVSNGLATPISVDSISVVGELSAERQQAVSKWENACAGSGFTYPDLKTGSGGDLSFRIDFHNSPRNDNSADNGCEVARVQRTNGVVSGAVIHIWAARRDGSSCNASRKDLIAHGMGHALGLADAYNSSCNGTIMGRPVPGSEMSMVQEVCAMVRSRWVLSSEYQGGGQTDPYDDDTGSGVDCGFAAGCGSPIVIDLGRNGFDFTSLSGGVHFDLDGDEYLESISWTDVFSDDAFLALDRDGNGIIDSGKELFGNYTVQPPTDSPNGFYALAVFDSPEQGGNGDGKISEEDAIFNSLMLWLDFSHDGYSQPEELFRIYESEIEEIELDYVESRRRDRYGNQLRWRSFVDFGHHRKKAAVDVLFLMEE